MLVSNSTGVKSANAVVFAGPGLITAITVIPAAAGSTVIIYDNTAAASGTVLAEAGAPANGSPVTVAFNSPIRANVGMYAAVAGSGATYIVHYAIG